MLDREDQEYVDWALSYAKNKNYHSAAQAIADYRRASLNMLHLQADMDGDWDYCGYDLFRMHRTMRNTAMAYLESVGVPPDDLPKLCDLCGYHDAKTQTENGVFDVCYKCKDQDDWHQSQLNLMKENNAA